MAVRVGSLLLLLGAVLIASCALMGARPAGPGHESPQPGGAASPQGQPGAIVPPGQRGGEPLLILAAADLQFALAEVAGQFEAATGRKVTVSLGSTGSFSAQIENGAPADLFFAANETFVDGLIAKDLLHPDTRQVYAVGRTVLVSPGSARFHPTSLRDLLRPEVQVIAIANPEHAPYGLAAQQALQRAGVWAAVQPKLVLGENIAQTFQLVQTGNADAGLVALSVALGVPGTSYTLVDEALHAPLRQAAAVLKRSRQPELARAFLDYVNGPEGRPIMRKYGFALPGED